MVLSRRILLPGLALLLLVAIPEVSLAWGRWGRGNGPARAVVRGVGRWVLGGPRRARRRPTGYRPASYQPGTRRIAGGNIPGIRGREDQDNWGQVRVRYPDGSTRTFWTYEKDGKKQWYDPTSPGKDGGKGAWRTDDPEGRTLGTFPRETPSTSEREGGGSEGQEDGEVAAKPGGEDPEEEGMPAEDVPAARGASSRSTAAQIQNLTRAGNREVPVQGEDPEEPDGEPEYDPDRDGYYGVDGYSPEVRDHNNDGEITAIDHEMDDFYRIMEESKENAPAETPDGETVDVTSNWTTSDGEDFDMAAWVEQEWEPVRFDEQVAGLEEGSWEGEASWDLEGSELGGWESGGDDLFSEGDLASWDAGIDQDFSASMEGDFVEPTWGMESLDADLAVNDGWGGGGVDAGTDSWGVDASGDMSSDGSVDV